MLTREQVVGLGMGDRSIERLVVQRHWRRLLPGVYLTAATEPGWRSLAWAGVLYAGERAVLGGSAAGFVHGLVDQPPATITVVIPHEQRTRNVEPWVFVRQRGLGSPGRGNPPRIGVESTVLWLCGAGRPEEAVIWVTTAVQRRLTTPGRLRRALELAQRQRHRQVIDGLVTDVAKGAHSPLEVLYARDVERAHGLPTGRRQGPSVSGSGAHDVTYDEQEVVVELDGRVWHDGMGRFRDMWRDNVSTLGHHLTLRYGAYDLYRQPCAVADQVAQALIQRGWRGLPTRCHRCRRVA